MDAHQPGRESLAGGRFRYGLAAWLLLATGGLAHLAYLINDCPLDLSGDEAHYWEWSRRLDLSYYSKGPLVAYIIAGSRVLLADWSRGLVGSEALAVRVPAILLSVGTGLGLYALGLATLRSPRLALAGVAITCTIPILAVGAVLMTIDAPLAFLYVWALVAVERGLRAGHTLPWVLAGLLVALGVLAKYTMLLIVPTVALVILVEADFRAVLRRPGPYLAGAIGLLGLVPIVLWNAEHDWVSFRHVAGQAGLAGRRSFDPSGPVSYLAGQAAVIGPIWLAGMLYAVISLWRRPREPLERHAAGSVRLLCVAALVPWLGFLAFSPLTKIQPNWPAVAVLPGTILLALWLSRLWNRPDHRVRRAGRALAVAGSVAGLATVVAVHYSEFLMPVFAWLARNQPPWNLTPVAKFDPTARLRGWSQLGAAVGEILRAEQAAGRDPFIATDDYQSASEIAFYCPGQPTVYCFQAALGDRQSQYDIWPNPIRRPEGFLGRPCIYVGSLKPELTGQGDSPHAALRQIRLAATVEHRVRGHLVRVWPIYVCGEYAGLPAELTGRARRF